MFRAARSRLALVLAILGLISVPAAAFAAPPVNDNYLQAISINAQGEPLRTTEFKDTKDTREATIQADLFAPPGSGGGSEPTTCAVGGPVVFGATVWYVFHPDVVFGYVYVNASGFGAVRAIYECWASFEMTMLASLGVRMSR